MMKVRIVSGAVVLALALAAAAAAATAKWQTVASGATAKWQTVASGGTERPVGQIGVARTSDGVLHVVWVRRTGGNSYDLVPTAISPAGKVGAATPIVTGWSGLGDAALTLQGGQLLAFFPGSRTTDTFEPFFGLNLATSGDGGGSWRLYGSGSIYTKEYAYGRTPGVAVVNDVPIETWAGSNGQVVHVGLDPSSPVSYYGPTACCLLNQNIAVDAAGQTWVAWCAMNDAPAGRWVQRVATPSGAPIGAPAKLAGSDGTLCEAAGREPLVARPGGGVFVADLGPANGTKVTLWRVGGGSLTVGSSPTVGGGRVALTAAPDGRLWVAWRSGAATHVRRSNRAGTVFGAEVIVPGPKDAVDVGHIDLAAQADRVDVLTSFSFADVARNTLFHTQVWPGLTLTGKGGNVVSFRVTDAGDPVAGATIKVGGKSLKTNAKGEVGIDLPAGRFGATASKAGYVSASANVKSS